MCVKSTNYNKYTKKKKKPLDNYYEGTYNMTMKWVSNYIKTVIITRRDYI